VRLTVAVLLVPICIALASCAGTREPTGLRGDWVRVADSICQQQAAAYRRDWAELQRQTAHGAEPKTALVQFYSRVSVQEQAMSHALRAELDPPRGSLAAALVASSAIVAAGLRQHASAVTSGDAAQTHQADVKVTDGTVPFLLLASVAHMQSCTDDGETAASSTPEQRVAFQASSDATWLCVTHGEQVPSTYRVIIEGYLRELGALATASPQARVAFIPHFHSSLTYRALARDAAGALGSPGCADDPALASLRAKLNSKQATSTTAAPT
jgi:hypothetical protein